MNEYTVEFRIYGVDLDVTAVTNELQIEPSISRLVGDRRDKARQWEDAMWSYNGFDSAQGIKSWNSLEEGLNFVLDRLWPVRSSILNYQSTYKVILWCGHFQSSANGGTTLSPSTLKRLAEFGVELFIDNYCSN